MNPENFFQRVPQETRKKVKKMREDTGTEINYAELTWSNRQILCDSLQNNLDAETRKFITKLEQEHIPDAERYIKQADADPLWKEAYLNILHLLHTLSVRAGDLNRIEKERLIRTIHQKVDELGINIRAVDGEHFENSKSPELPIITYAIKDTETGKVIRNLTQDDLVRSDYADVERFSLFEWKVEDVGGGYDATKSVLYLPTKKGERFSRGMFGEGLKVNQAAIARTPDVNLRMHSQFEKEDGSSVAWVRHVYPEDNIVMQKGLEVNQKVGDSTGSGTMIRFVNAQDENKELRETLDPRITDVVEVAAEFGKYDFSYPLGITQDGFVQPGIALDGNPSAQYLQGLRIGTSSSSLLFSYDFQNRDIIAGRDRNHLQPDVMRETIKNFWRENRDSTLCREFLQRVVLSDSDFYAPEREVFFESCKRLNDAQGSQQDHILLHELISLLDLRSDMPNYIATRGDGKTELIDEAKVHIVYLKISCDKDEATLLQELLKSRCTEYSFVSILEIMPEKASSMENADNTQEKFTEHEQKFINELNRMMVESSDEMMMLETKFERDHGKRQISPVIKYERAKYASEVRFNIEVESKERHITCYIPSSHKDNKAVPDLSNSDTQKEFKAKLMELRLAAMMLGAGSFRSNQDEYGEYAQMAAQKLLDQLSCPPEADEMLHRKLQSLHTKALVLQREQLQNKEQKMIIEDLKTKLQSYTHEMYNLQCAPERMREIMQWCREHSELDGTERLRDYLSQRVIVEGGVATYITKIHGGEKIESTVLNESNQVGLWKGYPEYELSNGYFILPVDTDDHAVLKINKHAMIAICDERAMLINTDLYAVTDSNNKAVKMDKGCIISISSLSKEDNEFSFHAVPQERDLGEKAIETGIVKSPATLEYISDHWSEPVRIFQDLGQNHMDAGGIDERFLIVKGKEKVWVTDDQLGDAEILGYELSDQGLGYSPEGIHTMGHTRKRNPFLTGKNGEGLKLAAASAKKQGFEITFASFGLGSNGSEVSWQAEAKTLPEEYTHDGKTNIAQRLVFDVVEKERSALEERSATTHIILPDDADEACLKRWSVWMNCVDPRNKDEHGNGGMDRYLLTNENALGNFSTVGPTTVLFERPGEIFENGTLIRTEQQAERSYTLGWNFPSITSTRERTHIDEDMAKAYMRHYFKNTTDESAVEHVLRSIQVHDINEYNMHKSNEGFSRIIDFANQKQEKRDVSPDWILSDSDSYPSLPLFQKKVQELYPDKILFSYELAKNIKMSMSGSMRHIRPEKRLNVSRDDYRVLRHMFPTMQDYMKDIENSIIDIEPNELEPLRSVVGDEIIRIEKALDRIEQNPKTAPIFEHILKISETTRTQISERLSELTPDAAAGTAADVFLMAEDSNADGLASVGIGLRVSLLEIWTRSQHGRMYGVIDHELVHKMLEARDYTTEFILLLGLLANDHLQQPSIDEQV